ncbi:MAG: alpha/beta hydrolase [Pseudomonadota bacterium]
MNFIYGLAFLALSVLLILFAMTRFGVWSIERSLPPDGEFASTSTGNIHHQFKRVGDDAPTVIFVHGASSNLHDQMSIYGDLLAGEFNALYYDRPGHGYSRIKSGTVLTPGEQADALAELMDTLDIPKAVIVGHSFGGAISVSMALRYPEKVSGLALLSPVSHPWPGGVNWYYDLASRPILGRFFVQAIALPAVLSRMGSGAACVFAPNPVTEGYLDQTRSRLLARPGHFRNNSMQVAALYDYVTEVSPRYGEIETPTVILTGNRDTIVLADIHSIGLKRQLPNADLYWVKNLGHKPDHVAPDFVVDALRSLTGSNEVDLAASAARLEARLGEQNYGPIDQCIDSDVIKNALDKPDEVRTSMVD